MKIRVVHIITTIGIGGAEMALYKLLSRMDRARFESMVIVLADDEAISLAPLIRDLGVPVYELHMSKGPLFIAAFWRLCQQVRWLRPDIIQGWMYHGNIAATLSRLFLVGRVRARAVRVLWNIRHSLHDIKYEKILTRAVIYAGAVCSRSVARMVYCSRASVRQHENVGYVAGRTVVIPNGFDVEHFRPSETARRSMRQSLGVRDDEIIIGLIAGFRPMKDHANFFRAARNLATEHKSVHFALAGPAVDRSNGKLLALIQDNQLNGQIHVLGERQDMPELMSAMDIATSASYGEGFSNAIAEAMACGVPCVVTDVGDSSWIVGDTGKVVPPHDANALAGAWAALIDVGKRERMRLGREARRRIIDNFSLDESVHQYETLYAQVAGTGVQQPLKEHYSR